MTNLEAVKILESGVLNGKDNTPENNEAIVLAISALGFKETFAPTMEVYLDTIKELKEERDAAIKELRKERDAAIEDLKNEAFCRCFVCKHHVFGMCVSDGVTDGDCWEWRGLENE